MFLEEAFYPMYERNTIPATPICFMHRFFMQLHTSPDVVPSLLPILAGAGSLNFMQENAYLRS